MSYRSLQTHLYLAHLAAALAAYEGGYDDSVEKAERFMRYFMEPACVLAYGGAFLGSLPTSALITTNNTPHVWAIEKI